MKMSRIVDLRLDNLRVDDLLTQAVQGRRLSLEEGLIIFKEADLLSLGAAADMIRKRLHPLGIVTFLVDRNINYTNVCSCQCRFCAFYRDLGDPQAYVLESGEILKKVEETVAVGGTGVMIQGGLHPDLGFDFYINMIKEIKSNFNVDIHSFSPPEIMHMSKVSGLPPHDVLRQLREAGLDSLPGGGAEILVNRVRRAISPRKITWQEWMEVMHQAHCLGMKTTATMMFGHLETLEERLLHMVRVREQQDRGGGYTAFIPWSYQPLNTELGGVTSGGLDYLRTLAVSRIMLDNINNIQASWVTQGSKIAQVALAFGANDFGSTMLEENVVRAAGVSFKISMAEIISCIKDAGFKPAQRRSNYHIVQSF